MRAEVLFCLMKW